MDKTPTTNYGINMISLTDNPNFVIPKDGTYLVQTYSVYGPGFKHSHWLTTYVSKHENSKTGVWHNSYSCSGTVTHVSEQPLKCEETSEEKKTRFQTLIEKIKNKYANTI